MITKSAEDALERLSYLDSVKARNRAIRKNDTLMGKMQLRDDLKQDMEREMVTRGIRGGLIGGNVGAGLSIPAFLASLDTSSGGNWKIPVAAGSFGALVGGLSGMARGKDKAREKFLSERGIHPAKSFFRRHFTRANDITPEAKAKYLPDATPASRFA
jgi:hypothetical protein